MKLRRSLTVLCIAAASTGVAACGEDEKDSTADNPKASEILGEGAAQTQTEAAPAPTSSAKPTVAKQTGPDPKTLQTKDLKAGTGKAAKKGDQLSMNYVGVLRKDGKEFDNSYDRGQPFEFALGAGNVIKGWDQGIVGMKEGGRRQLTIPAPLGYGAQGTPDGSIPPNSALVFVVDLISIG